ncbi:hypothetical protein Tco_1052312 [Tanacetum coccineum]
MKSKKKSMKNLTMDVVNQDVGVCPLRNWIDFGFEDWILWFLCRCVRHSSNRGKGKSEMGCLVMDFAEDKGISLWYLYRHEYAKSWWYTKLWIYYISYSKRLSTDRASSYGVESLGIEVGDSLVGTVGWRIQVWRVSLDLEGETLCWRRSEDGEEIVERRVGIFECGVGGVCCLLWEVVCGEDFEDWVLMGFESGMGGRRMVGTEVYGIGVHLGREFFGSVSGNTRICVEDR